MGFFLFFGHTQELSLLVASNNTNEYAQRQLTKGVKGFTFFFLSVTIDWTLKPMENNDNAGCCSSGRRVCFNDKKTALGGQSLLRKHPFRLSSRGSDLAIPRTFALINIHYILRTSVRCHPVLARSSPLIIFISASLFISFFALVCVCVEVRLAEMWKPLEVSPLERRGGGENREVLPFSFIIL